MTLPSTIDPAKPRKVKTVKRARKGSATNRKRSPKDKQSVTVGWVLMFALLLLGCLGGYRALLNWQQQQQDLFETKLQEELDPMTREWEEKMVHLQEEKDALEGKDSTNQEALNRLTSQVRKWKGKATKLEKSIKELSTAELIQK